MADAGHPGAREPDLAAIAARLAAEMRVRPGPVPERLERPARETPLYAIGPDDFLLRMPSGLGIHYRRGSGVVVEQPASVPAGEVALLLDGSVGGAVCYLNGLVALHASAVVSGGCVHAFTAASGGGKSTLAAALAQRGLPVFADDVLRLVPGSAGPVQCLPGTRRMKLWSDACALTGTAAGEPVHAGVEKFYVAPAAVAGDDALPLAALYVLTDEGGDRPTLAPVTGAARIDAVRAAFYRPLIYAAITDRRVHFATVARIGGAVPVRRFDRPLDRDRFEAGVDLVAQAIRGADGRA